MNQKPTKQKTNSQKLKAINFAESATILTASITLFTTFLRLINPSLTTITPLLQALYAPFGYTITLPGALLATLYVAIDTFILTYLFAFIYNKLL